MDKNLDESLDKPLDETKWYKKPEMIVALSALFISLVTAIVAIYSANIDRAYAKASVWPRLEVFRSFGADNFAYVVSNNGNGPALIKYAKVQYQSKPVHYWRDIPDLSDFVQSHVSSRILSSQTEIRPLVYSGKETKTFLERDKNIEIEICYCSIYEECWVIDRVNQPSPVEQCEIEQSSAFRQ